MKNIVICCDLDQGLKLPIGEPEKDHWELEMRYSYN